MSSTELDGSQVPAIGTRAAPSVPYLRIEEHRGGAWRRWLYHCMLRATARRMRIADLSLPRLRAQQAVLDRRLAQPDREAVHTDVAHAHFAGHWIDVPASRPDRVLLYLHGGAFVFRYPALHAAFVAGWCRLLAARALLVDYRLAPEFPYPAGLDDCTAAYRWLLEQGIAPQNVVVAGDSAGASLALCLLLRQKARGEPMPACAAMLSPVVDFTLSSPSLVTNERRDPIFTLATLLALRRLYTTPESFLDPGVSPLFGDFEGLPPLLFQVGDQEMLLDETLRVAARAYAAGVTVEAEVWTGMSHVFQAQATLPQARRALCHVAAFVGRHAGWRE